MVSLKYDIFNQTLQHLFSICMSGTRLPHMLIVLALKILFLNSFYFLVTLVTPAYSCKEIEC